MPVTHLPDVRRSGCERIFVVTVVRCTETNRISASIVTYCRRSLHDRYFFADPLRILDGVIAAPSFNLKNPLMVAKHVRSAVVSILLLKSRQDGEVSERIRLVLKHLFPHFIRDYLLDNENHFRNAPISTNSLKTLMAELPNLPGELVELFANNWAPEAAELATVEAVRGIIAGMHTELTVVLTRLHNRLTWARNTRKELHRKKDDGIIEREEEQLLWRCDDYIKSIVKRDAAASAVPEVSQTSTYVPKSRPTPCVCRLRLGCWFSEGR
jgi:hypothetical protein